MNPNIWNSFTKAKEEFRGLVGELERVLPQLQGIQQEFVNSRSDGKNSAYNVETPVVYNSALDELTLNDEIKLILVADNPGRREQAAENRRYLVGPSGKIAAKFFRDNPVLGIDFYKNVIILNKTPIHSPRTIELRQLCSMEKGINSKTKTISEMLESSQRAMASLLLKFQEALACPVWITGYSEMRKNGLFEVYTERLKELYAVKKDLFKQVFIYRHFSMNQFTIDLKQQTLPGESLMKSLKRIGTEYKKRILE